MERTETEHFHDLLKAFDTAVLVTHDQTSQSTHFRSRPMAIARVEENCDLWFITNVDSAKVHEIEADTRAHVICQNGRSSCVTVSGRARIVEDRGMVGDLWRPAYRVWFPQGMNDPRLVLIKLEGERGEYWDNTGANGITYMYQAIKAVVTGTTPEVAEGEQHGVINLQHRF